jgi:hypothetical protein
MPPPPRSHQIAQFDVQPSSNLADPPCSAASFEVNSEPHTGARPSVRLCVGLIITYMSSYNTIQVSYEGLRVEPSLKSNSPCIGSKNMFFRK